VTGFLLNTNVTSEIAKTNPDPRVIAFLDHLKDGYISIITAHELYFGIHRLASGRRRDALATKIENFLSLYEDRVLSIAEPEARAAAILRITTLTQGRTLHIADALIGAAALVNGLTLATPDNRDFQGLGVALYNPWNS